MIELRNNYWAVEVPDGAINFIIDMGYIIWKSPNYKNWCNDTILSDYDKLSKYLETHKAEDDYKTGGLPLPPGAWEIVCTSKEVTHEQVWMIVESVDSEGRGLQYINYANGIYVFSNAKSSFRTLLTQKGCDLKNNYLILKKTA